MFKGMAWHTECGARLLCDEPYFINLAGALKMLHDSSKLEIFTLSAYYKNCPWILDEKNKFINSRCPWIDSTHRIFTEVGHLKAAYVLRSIQTTDLLIDDYSSNLLHWSDHGLAVKFLNGLNGSGCVWTGPCIDDVRSSAKDLVVQLTRLTDKTILREDLNAYSGG